MGTEDNIRFLYRLRNKKNKQYEAFNTWFRSPKLAFAPLKVKFKRYGKHGTHYDPKDWEAVEYMIKETRTINVDED